MSEDSIDYGNWVPKKLLFIVLCIAIIFTIVSILLLPLLIDSILTNKSNFSFYFILSLVLWVIAGFSIICTIFFTSLHRAFKTNNGELQDKIRNIVLDKLQWGGEGKALDIGTGSGYLAIKLAQSNLKTEAIGIDYWGHMWGNSQEVCEQNAKSENVKERTKFQKANASNLPFENEYFDAIVSNLVFHNIIKVRDKSELFKEALRVLKKGGVFSIQDIVKNKRSYGNFEKLKQKIKECGVAELNYIDTNDKIKMSRSARMEFKTMGIFYGRK